ncbi:MULTISPECIES: tyrosine-type recombinase/integrase [Pseudomonas]|uniref:tyrosine-type recombinase/integrase n=1 Tax=Pseudomonas TaxID=286 RepID=UPI000733C69C|nr:MULTISPECIES: tyrosine-type recombinase/integrase [Pseudomonas]MBF8680546.1 tyrosine-type recombinase/integrase [Pseudomonas fulva]MBF8719028.1 tyrosine-type recombinase/integrase [Pseudomonas fulva]MBF8784185.1 tyrosine-type recombinase/integrase [Pseudomonas fulva]MBH3344058.1 tyrosine-type recombinase/integrase [Pseudomonas parafulva]MEC4024521.1 tyrosine-type recombinase/integrase [Pseudomonas fulva]
MIHTACLAGFNRACESVFRRAQRWVGERLIGALNRADAGGLGLLEILENRTKTKRTRKVLLNDRALYALEKPRPLTEARSDDVFAPSGTDDRSALFRRPEASQKRYWLAASRMLGIRPRRMHDTRHTYATMCLVAGMNPAFIAAQLGHSVQVLLSMRQVDQRPNDWAQFDQPKHAGSSTNAVRAKSQ